MSETKARTQTTYRMYKARKTNDGAASQWQLSSKKSKRENEGTDIALYLTMAKQTGTDENDNAQFDWRTWNKETNSWNPSSSISFKLGLTDIGELLAVINGQKSEAGMEGKGLYHSNDNGSSTLHFSPWVKDGKLMGYNLKVYSKAKDSKDGNSISHSVSVSESEILRELLRSSVLQMAKWSL